MVDAVNQTCEIHMKLGQARRGTTQPGILDLCFELHTLQAGCALHRGSQQKPQT